ncbi:hypothetical protein [Clostridium beijerinckii]|uniref:Phage protein n=1 Tax=Clostridium beijerinckii TaxID=1520 RepID=A0AAW3W5Q3_CLOBE|nr:hypothetical protein [Clostridium beijerinckii]MBC2457148.1 hypothetical protein [Clostridium beijerinckii]MBC2474205.1 hypothetical protein [Clostridium beijerinckii]NOV58696.1 hypothetical protein [Clostridium beijerinckii]NOV71919.1 hypothetical protein [Clostridium beijerinckii]NOW32051.1 hypothetical protein [Clostridium beijerinckii]
MSKKLRLNPENLVAIQAAIDEAEGKATTRCLSADRLLKMVKSWEVKAFSPPKYLLRDTYLIVQASADKVAKAYKYTPQETVVCVEHDSVGWYIDRIERRGVRTRSWNVTALIEDKLEYYILRQATTA